MSTTKGLLVPRVASAAALTSPARALLVYQTGTPAGFYYNARPAPAWQQLGGGRAGGDNLGNQTAKTTLLLGANGLTDTGASIGAAVGVGVLADGGLNLGQNTAGNNILLGYQAGQAMTSGISNLFSGNFSSFSNTTGSNNTALGYGAGPSTAALTNATAIGANAVVSQSNSLVLGNAVNVGIGTNSPVAGLHIDRPESGSAAGC